MKINHFESPREKELADRVETAGLKIKDIFQEESDLALWWQASKHEPKDVARLVFPLYAWDLEENQIKEKVKEWGLMNAKNHSPIVTNHQLVALLALDDPLLTMVICPCVKLVFASCLRSFSFS